MSESISQAEAREALIAAERSRRQVIDQIGMPDWYWWVLALGWIVVGLAADLDRPWVTAAATFGFGTLHAAIYGTVAGGRHRHPGLSVRSESIRLPMGLVVIGSLLVLVVLTIVITLLLAADGARHPSTIAGVFVGVMVLLGGPALMSWVRKRALGIPLP